MRGYFGIGVEGVSKAMNAGSLFRSAHAFGASFVFTVAAQYDVATTTRSDTSGAAAQIPFYEFPDGPSLLLPKGCALVGVELTDDAVELPSFRHPRAAAYIMGPERGNLSDGMVARCDHVIKIPTSFCVNVGIAGAVVMYDRLISMGRFAGRPVSPGGPTVPLSEHVHGGPVIRSMAQYQTQPPAAGYEEDDR